MIQESAEMQIIYLNFTTAQINGKEGRKFLVIE